MTGKTPPRIAVLGTLASAALLLAVAAPPALAVEQRTVPYAAEAEHPEAGPLALGSAAVAVGAGVFGIALLRRRRAERADSSEDGRS
ncbi:hypothetical protein [Streptomyces luteolus]|uniref:Gram-positive cocci surface proteins LPxTG domain-containing protein n=1 Tax=Streptomyces luteolus TaxID=3043615 RepID=A0ABT6T9C2_9ACTN|nr:hypothetical protein [Streptomyces sp. B-S-A12]MDI3423968.1 hypothetical protein [Streptomyces sp. B-S-A12]